IYLLSLIVEFRHMPAPKFEKDGTPHITMKERLLARFQAMTPEQMAEGIVLSDIQAEMQQLLGREIAWGSFYKAYQRLQKDQKAGLLPEGVAIPALQQAHDSTRRERVTELLAQNASIQDVMAVVGSGKSNIERIRREAGLSTPREPLTEQELSQILDAWNNQGLGRRGIVDRLGISYSRVRYALHLLKQQGRIVDKTSQPITDDELSRAKQAWNVEGLPQPQIEIPGVSASRLNYILNVLRDRKELVERRPKAEIKRRDDIILNLTRQGLSSDEIAQALKEGWEVDMTSKLIAARINKMRGAGKLPRFTTREEHRQWLATRREITQQEEKERALREQLGESAAEIRQRMVTLLSEGGRINFITDNRGFEIFRLAIHSGEDIFGAFAKNLKRVMGTKASTLNYVRERRQDGSYLASLVFNDQISTLLTNEAKTEIDGDTSPHAKLFLRTLEYLRNTYLLQAAHAHGIEEFPQDMIPTVAEMLLEVARQK
ncbi:MAG TPA: hypothetical protein VFQ63_02885, partial [Patescibacteria group bacterium]|nr:hypothetical protein [Patescibacteria group bacterium]